MRRTNKRTISKVSNLTQGKRNSRRELKKAANSLGFDDDDDLEQGERSISPTSLSDCTTTSGSSNDNESICNNRGFDDGDESEESEIGNVEATGIYGGLHGKNSNMVMGSHEYSNYVNETTSMLMSLQTPTRFGSSSSVNSFTRNDIASLNLKSALESKLFSRPVNLASDFQATNNFYSIQAPVQMNLVSQSPMNFGQKISSDNKFATMATPSSGTDGDYQHVSFSGICNPFMASSTFAVQPSDFRQDNMDPSYIDFSKRPPLSFESEQQIAINVLSTLSFCN
jgi:hypothetical protein